MTSPGRSGSSARRIRASTRFRRLWSAIRDVQHHRRTFCTWNAEVAAASGRAAPISRWTSGKAAHGRVCTGPDLLLTVVRASL